MTSPITIVITVITHHPDTSANPASPAAAPRTPTPDPAYSSGGAYNSAGGAPYDAAAGEDASDKASQQGSSYGGAAAPVERKKSGSLKGMLKKLKA